MFCRWEAIAEYVSHHSKGAAVKTSRHVIKKVKELQKLGKDSSKPAIETTIFLIILIFFVNFLDSAQKDQVNKNAFAKFDKTVATPSSAASSLSNPSERYDNGKCFGLIISLSL